MRPSRSVVALAVGAAALLLLASSPLRRIMPVIRYGVDGPSMEPTYRQGDRVVVNRLAYAGRRPVAGDVVVFRDPDDASRHLIKRVAAAPGADGSVFVLGDNPAASKDSRVFGPVPRERIVGKAMFKY
jgi:signal peptidase I